MPTIENPSQTHAVILSGGGAFGAFEVGVLQALVEGASPATAGAPLEATIFTGTSVGAYNAAVMASKGPDARSAAAYLENVWKNRIAGGLTDNGVYRLRGNPAPLLNPARIIREGYRPVLDTASDLARLSAGAAQRLGRLVISSHSLVHRTAELFNLESLISTEPLQQLVRETLSLPEILASRKVLKMATTDWRTGGLRVFSHDPSGRPPHRTEQNGQLTENTWPHALLASTAIPGVFPKVLIAGTPFVDGGVVMNTPMKPAIAAGAEVIHLVYLIPDVDTGPAAWNDAWPNTLETVGRALDLAISAAVDADVETANLINTMLESGKPDAAHRPLTVHRYNPARNLGGLSGLLDFGRSSISDSIRLGEEAALKHNCVEEGCVIPGKPHQRRVQRC